MIKQIAIVAALLCDLCPSLFADFSYEQTSKITGGMIAGMMKFAGVFSKKAREPIRTEVLVKGDRMVHWNADSASIIDLGKETITEVNFEKKQYSVITFDQMMQALKRAEEKMKSSKEAQQAEMSMKVSVKDTGQTKQIATLNARLVVLTLEMEGKDKQSGEKGAMVITSDLWLAPNVAGYEEVKSFYQRMGQKLAWTPGGGMFAQGRSDIAKGMADVYKEAAKLDGVPVYQVIRMGAKVEGQPGSGGAPPAQQTQAEPREQPQEKPSMRGALGGLGGLGRLGRRKKQEEQPAPPPQAQSSGAQQGGTPGLLMEMTSELTGFSAGPVDVSKFAVPAGFKQVESETVKALQR